MQEYEQICKHVGKMVLQYSFEIERIAKQSQELMENTKKTLDEKNKRIKDLEDEVAKLKVK